MNRKTITMDYEEYKDLLEQIEILKEFVTDYYNRENDERIKRDIHKFMQKYGNWL